MTWLVRRYLRAFSVTTLLVMVAASVYDAPQKPFISHPPRDFTITRENATLTCLSGGSRPLTVDWVKDSKRLDLKGSNYLAQSVDGSLHILFADMKRDQGRYRCIVGNSVGFIMSPEAFISFPYMDGFAMPDSEVTVNEGSSAVLLCHAPKSFPDRLIWWSKYDPQHPYQPTILSSAGNAHLSVNTNGDLYFAHTKDSDAGGYYCNVENHFFTEVKRRTVAVVIDPVKTQQNYPPRIWKFSPETGIVGERLVIECISQGRPVPRVKLIDVNRNLEVGSLIGNIRRYVIRRVTMQSQGRYHCEVSNAFGQTDKKRVFVTVEASPRWTLPPTDSVTDIGSSARIDCVASGIPVTSYRWFYNGTLLPRSSDYTLVGGNLTINAVLPFHAGMYQCEATNKHGSILGAVQLQIVEIPAGFGVGSLAPRDNSHVLVDGIAELTCNPTGSPRPVIRWRHEGRQEEVVAGEHYTIMPSGNLRINSVKRRDEGRYTCTVTNKLSQDRRSGYLTVRDGVAIIDAPQAQEAIVGHAVNLTCGVLTSDDLEVSFQWLKNGIPLRESAGVAVVSAGSRNIILQFSSISSSDSGLYTCIATATDAVGTKDDQSAYLEVVGPMEVLPTAALATTPDHKSIIASGDVKTPWPKGVPGPPTDVTVSRIKGHTCRVSWMLGRDNGKPVTTVYIEYRTANPGNLWRVFRKITNISSNGVADLVLSPWTSYKFRVISSNVIGNSSASTETPDWLHTAPAVPMLYPKPITSFGTGPNEITISWEPLPTSEQNGPGIYYLIHHRQADSQTKFYTDRALADASSFVLKGAEFYYQYDFQVQAANAIGVGPRSPVMKGYTGERSPLGAPKNLQIKIASATHAVAKWEGVKNDRQIVRGELLGYKLFYWVDAGLDAGHDMFYRTSTVNGTTLTLAPATSYLFQVVAYNRIGNGPRSNIIGPLLMPEDVPSMPQRIWISYAEPGLANVSWQHPQKSNGVLTGHVLRYQALPDGDVMAMHKEAHRSWAVVSNLYHGVSYKFSVSSTTKVGEGQQRDVTFDFTQLPLVKPSELEATAVGVSTVVLTWSPINQADITGYKVYYWRSGDAQSTAFTVTEQKNDLLTPISNLEPQTAYLFQVSGLNQFGAGARTDPLKVVTLQHKGNDRIATRPSSGTATKASMLVLILCVGVSTAVMIGQCNQRRRCC